MASAAMETKPSEQTDVIPSSSQQDTQQQTQQTTNVCLHLYIEHLYYFSIQFRPGKANF